MNDFWFLTKINNNIHLVLLPIVNEEKLLIKSFSYKGKDGQVNSPNGIITQGTNIYVVDSGNNRIQKFSLLWYFGILRENVLCSYYHNVYCIRVFKYVTCM